MFDCHLYFTDRLTLRLLECLIVIYILVSFLRFFCNSLSLSVSYIFQILNYTQAMNLHTMEAVLLFQNCTHPLLRLKAQKLSTNVINSAK